MVIVPIMLRIVQGTSLKGHNELGHNINFSTEEQLRCTVNGKRFAGLNFCVFGSFQEYHKSFSYLYILYKLRMMALLKCFKCKAP